MVHKRPLVEESADNSSKHSKLDHGGRLVPFLEFPFHDGSHRHYTLDLGKSCFSECKAENHVNLDSGKNNDFPVFTAKDIDVLPGNDSNSSWPSSCMSEEDVSPKSQDYSPFRPRRIIMQPEDAYSYLMQRPPQKPIPIGPDFQADIPDWCDHDAKNVSTCSDFTEASTSSQALKSNLNSSVGNCIVPMPAVDPASCDIDKVGSGRSDCCCEDRSSFRCVRQHVGEARVNLIRSVGLDRFLELGFGDMGETVAEKWSKEDEKLFHDIVFSNPASSGKNFWHHLASAFPSRTSFEIVSYYFNVFMLRKRAEQNRCIPTVIDSDNDDWEGIDESGEDGTCENEIYEDNSYDQQNEDVTGNPNCDAHEKFHLRDFKDRTNVSETWPMDLLNNYGSNSGSDKTVEDEMGANDFLEDSGMTFDGVVVPQVSQEKVEDGKHPQFSQAKVVDGKYPQVSQEKVEDGKHWGQAKFSLEPCDAKVWDTGYSTFPRTKADFLPTYSMIEEVFGVEDRARDTRDHNNST